MGTTSFNAGALSRAGGTFQEWQAELGYQRVVVKQQVGDNVWQWRSCGRGIGPWVGTSTGLNVGKGTGEVLADGTGTFEYHWTSYGQIGVDFRELGTLRLATQKAADGKSRYLLTALTTSATGYWNMPRPIGKRPIDPGATPSPQGDFVVAAERLDKQCDPRNP
jgi:hypothetical protein